jgi:hypothetical protein
MKHAMTLSLLVACVCAVGGAAAAQQGSGAAAPANQGTTGTSPNDMPDSRTNAPGSQSPAGTDMSTPRKPMTRAEKKESLDRIKKAIRDAGSGAEQLSGQGTGAMAGPERGEATGRAGAPGAGSTMGAVEHLKVYRRGDKVILRGTVHSQADKDRLGAAAATAAPDENIVNELKIK